jgi:hypothetical protein
MFVQLKSVWHGGLEQGGAVGEAEDGEGGSNAALSSRMLLLLLPV